MSDGAAVHGSLDSVSAYAFENQLGTIKKSVTSSRDSIVTHDSIVTLVKGMERRKSNFQGHVLKQPKKPICITLIH